MAGSARLLKNRDELVGARRYRAYRQRRRNGKACLRIEINMGEWADALVSIPGGFLQQWDNADKAAVERATEKFLTFLIAEHGDR